VAPAGDGLASRRGLERGVSPGNREGWLTRQLEGSAFAIEYFHLAVRIADVRPVVGRRPVGIESRSAHSHEFTMAVLPPLAAWRAGVPARHHDAWRSLLRRLASVVVSHCARPVVLSGLRWPFRARLQRQVSRDLSLRPSRIRRPQRGAVRASRADNPA